MFQKISSTVLVLTSLVALGATAAAAPASIPVAVDDDSHALTLVVSAGGLDLASADGQARMRRRVEKATRIVCEDAGNGGFQACYAATLSQTWSEAQVKIAQAVGHSLYAAAKP